MARSAGARLFVAVDLPELVRERLAGWARAAIRGTSVPEVGSGTVRVLDPDSLHLTVCFLGDCPTSELAAIGGAVQASAHPLGELALGAPVWLPAGRPRVLAVEVRDPEGDLNALRGRLVAALGQVVPALDGAGGPRRFRPHITVARMGARGWPKARALPATPSLVFAPQTMALYRSFLAPAGATYQALETVGLTGRSPGP